MYTEQQIQSAVEAGILTGSAAEALKAHVANLQNNASHMPVAFSTQIASAEIAKPLSSDSASQAVDEEHFKLVTGFNDIFVVIAAILLLSAVSWIFGSVKPWCGNTAAAVTAWGLSEYFIKQRKMALPAIVLMLAFVSNVLFMVLAFGEVTINPYRITHMVMPYVFGGLAAAAASWLHWRRFYVPITVAAGAAALIGCLMVMLAVNPEVNPWLSVLSFIAGAMVFATALTWDAADTTRSTRKSDVAFWLHLLAAPLLVHPIFMQLQVFNGDIHFAQAALVLLLYGLIGFVSLMIDRRALMVSALAYVLYTFSTLLKTLGVVDLGFAITALAIGAGLLMLSAFWHRCRQWVLKLTPQSLKAYLPK